MGVCVPDKTAGVGGELMAELGDIGRSSVVDVILSVSSKEPGQVARRSLSEKGLIQMLYVDGGFPRTEERDFRREDEAPTCALSG